MFLFETTQCFRDMANRYKHYRWPSVQSPFGVVLFGKDWKQVYDNCSLIWVYKPQCDAVTTKTVISDNRSSEIHSITYFPLCYMHLVECTETVHVLSWPFANFCPNYRYPNTEWHINNVSRSMKIDMLFTDESYVMTANNHQPTWIQVMVPIVNYYRRIYHWSSNLRGWITSEHPFLQLTYTIESSTTYHSMTLTRNDARPQPELNNLWFLPVHSHAYGCHCVQIAEPLQMATLLVEWEHISELYELYTVRMDVTNPNPFLQYRRVGHIICPLKTPLVQCHRTNIIQSITELNRWVRWMRHNRSSVDSVQWINAQGRVVKWQTADDAYKHSLKKWKRVWPNLWMSLKRRFPRELAHHIITWL